MAKKISRGLGLLIILANLAFFIPLTFQIISTMTGETCNLGIALLPITSVTNLFFVPGTLAWIIKAKSQTALLIINCIGSIWTIFWLKMFL